MQCLPHFGFTLQCGNKNYNAKGIKATRKSNPPTHLNNVPSLPLQAVKNLPLLNIEILRKKKKTKLV